MGAQTGNKKKKKALSMTVRRAISDFRSLPRRRAVSPLLVNAPV